MLMFQLPSLLLVTIQKQIKLKHIFNMSNQIFMEIFTEMFPKKDGVVCRQRIPEVFHSALSSLHPLVRYCHALNI